MTGTRSRRDTGSASMFTVIFAFFVIVLAGLLVDGGLAIHARQRAADIAEQAARATADDIDVAHLRATGEAKIKDAGVACARADRLLRAYGDEVAARTCDVSAANDQATVRVTIVVKLQLLSIVPGFDSFKMDSQATAEPQQGI
jgi:Flp pilus assembly protein TadG